MIELDEKSYIIGVWFYEDPVTGNNWLACCIADPNNKGRFKVWSRTRYVKDDKIFDSDDEKRWINFSIKEGLSENDIIRLMDKLQLQIAYKPVCENLDKIIVQGNLEKLFELSKEKPWLHMKNVI